jgi:hypothetical protein
MKIGFDHELDSARGFTVSEGGVVVIGKVDGLVELSDPLTMN